VNGTVTKVNFRVGEVLGSAQSGSFGKMVSKDYIIEAQVPESDVVKLSLGQKAFATFDSLDPDEKFEADIVEIEPDATVIQDVVYYVVKLRLKDLDSRLKTGMSTDVSVEVARKTSTLFVPRRAVRDAEGKSQVEVLADSGTPEKRTVETGIEDGEGNIEILSGVKEGDVLIVEMKSK
jgi:HlyD family secretion protein